MMLFLKNYVGECPKEGIKINNSCNLETSRNYIPFKVSSIEDELEEKCIEEVSRCRGI